LDNFKKAVKKILNFLTGRKPFRKRRPLLNDVKRILVISLYFKGDFLFHTAFLEALKTLLSGSKIDLWVKSRLADIVENDPRFNKVMVFDDIRTVNYREQSSFNLKGKINFLKKLRKNKYDLVIDLTGKYSTALFTLFSSPGYSVGINYNFFGFCYDSFVELNTSTEKGHLIEKYISVIPKGLHLKADEWNSVKEKIEIRPYIYIDDDTRRIVEEKLSFVRINKENKLIILHATSGWKAKEMNAKIFSELVKYFNSKKYDFVFVGDDGEISKLEEIKSFLTEDEIDFKRQFLKLKMLQTAELIRRSDLFIGSDSAPLHIAGAVGVPTIGIFGPTNPGFSAPVGKLHHVVYHQLFCSAEIDRQYCSRNAGFTCATIDCMKMVKSQEIIKLIEQILN